MKEVVFELEFVGVETWGWGSFFVEFNKLVPANTVTRKFFQELK